MRITEPLAFGAACTLGLLLFLCVPATAGTVRGTVQFPDEVKGGDLRHGGYWRVPNGVLPIGPPLHDVRSEAVVVLVPVGAIDVAASDGQRRAEIRLAGLRMSPQVTVVSPGAQVTLHNDDRVLHRLSCSGAAPLPEQSIPTGGRGTLTLQKAGDYLSARQKSAVRSGLLLPAQAYQYNLPVVLLLHLH